MARAERSERATVAVIEDDEASRYSLGRLLDVAGFAPTLFESAEAFIASRPHRAWLCLIVDVQLAGMSGIDLKQHLNAEGSDVPVIVVTANRDNAVRELAERAGCAAFFWKPFNPDEILLRVQSFAAPLT